VSFRVKIHVFVESRLARVAARIIFAKIGGKSNV